MEADMSTGRIELPRPFRYRLSNDDLGSEWVVEDADGAVVERFRIESWERGIVTLVYADKSEKTKWRSTVERRITDGVWLPPDDSPGRFV
jgi:hypothetical protein